MGRDIIMRRLREKRNRQQADDDDVVERSVWESYEAICRLGVERSSNSNAAVAVYAVAERRQMAASRAAAAAGVSPCPRPRLYACKVYDYFHSGADDGGRAGSAVARRREQSATTELQILRDLKHPHLLGLHDWFRTTRGCALIMPMMHGGSLSEVLAGRRGGRLSEDDARDVARGVLLCLAHLHSKGVAHRDVKLENIFLEDKHALSKVRLGDLGMAKKLTVAATANSDDSSSRDGQQKRGTSIRSAPGVNTASEDISDKDDECSWQPSGRRRHSICGTPLYVAPEVIATPPVQPAAADSQHDEQPSADDDSSLLLSCYDLKVDVWSCGVVLYIMLSGQTPFPLDLGAASLLRLVRRGDYYSPLLSPAWAPVSSSAIDLVLNMMTLDPGERPTAAECLQHPWLATATPAEDT